jgi:hypothetical protein
LRHELQVRQFGVWRILRWEEPVTKKDPGQGEAAALGRMLRDLIQRTVDDPVAVRCR